MCRHLLGICQMVEARERGAGNVGGVLVVGWGGGGKKWLDSRAALKLSRRE